jgi:hypothetical protein
LLGFRVEPRDPAVRPELPGAWQVTDGKRFTVVGDDPQALIQHTIRWI